MLYWEGNIWMKCCVDILGKTILGRKKSQYKGPEAEVYLPCSSNCREANGQNKVN